jgi:hypothetical protein
VKELRERVVIIRYAMQNVVTLGVIIDERRHADIEKEWAIRLG